MMYNKIVRDCFFSPKHVGVIDLSAPFVVHVRSAQQKQTALIDMYLQCHKDGVIERACFKSNGNPYVIAAMECLCRYLAGQAIATLAAFDYQTLIRELEIPTNQYPVALQVEAIYKEILGLMKKKLEDKVS